VEGWPGPATTEELACRPLTVRRRVFAAYIERTNFAAHQNAVHRQRRRVRMPLPRNAVLTKNHSRIWKHALQLLDTLPLRLCRLNGVASNDRQFTSEAWGWSPGTLQQRGACVAYTPRFTCALQDSARAACGAPRERNTPNRHRPSMRSRRCRTGRPGSRGKVRGIGHRPRGLRQSAEQALEGGVRRLTIRGRALPKREWREANAFFMRTMLI
jgi:hypothetical protein